MPVNLFYQLMLKKSFPIACFLLATLMLFSACSHRVVRQGYNQTYDDAYVIKKCNPKFVFPSENLELPDNFLGEVKLSDKGFSTKCSKADALQILSEEACSLNADLIVVTDERFSDLASTCYRCRARFYNSKEAPANLQQDAKEMGVDMMNEEQTNPLFTILGYILGFAVGYAIGTAIFR